MGAAARVSMVYLLAVPGTIPEPEERLIRLLAPRREREIELRVHYEITRTNESNGCKLYRIITIDETD